MTEPSFQTRRIAVMQPYFLPYLGYFQLMAAADVFVIYDDVHFVNRGWINRNRLLLGGQAHMFTVPLSGASQNRLISEISLHDNAAGRPKLLRTVHQAYRGAPQFDALMPLIERVVDHRGPGLAAFLRHSLVQLSAHLGLRCRVVESSSVYGNGALGGEARILDICRREGATEYLNLPGGMALYEPAHFAGQGLGLRFLSQHTTDYAQGGAASHVRGLSMLDVLMWNTPAEVQRLLFACDWV